MNHWSKPIVGSCHDLGHTWCRSCWKSFLQIFYYCFRYSLQVYSPLYLVAGILNKKSKEYFIKKMIVEILQSCTFLSINGACYVGSFCVLNQLSGGVSHWLTVGLWPGIIASFLAIIVERKSRRSLLALYMSNVALEIIYNIMKSRGYAVVVPYGEVYLFMISSAIMMFLFRNNALPDGVIKKLIRFILDVKESPTLQLPSLPFPDKSWLYQPCKMLVIGYVMQLLPNLLFSLKKGWRKPEVLLKAIMKVENLRFGSFLASFVLLYRIAEYMSFKIRRKSDSWNSFIAGGVSGLSMLFQRSSTLSLYLFSKLGEIFYMKGARKGYLPLFSYGDTVLYTISTAIMFHAAAMEPQNLRPAYWNFLLKLTNFKFAELNRKRFDALGFESSKMFPNFDPPVPRPYPIGIFR